MTFISLGERTNTCVCCVVCALLTAKIPFFVSSYLPLQVTVVKKYFL